MIVNYLFKSLIKCINAVGKVVLINVLKLLHNIFYIFSQLGNEESLASFELQISAKDYCFGRKNRLLGVAVIPLRDIYETGSFASWCVLGRSLFMNETGWTILRILSQRSNDEIARDFVMLKFDRRIDSEIAGLK